MADLNNYNLQMHQHRFASWCAATASRTSPNCRFSVETGVKIIEQSRLNKIFIDYESLPSSQSEFDNLHKSVCNCILQTAENFKTELKGKTGEFTYGISAKLLNCYLKSIYLSSFQMSKNQKDFDKRLNYIHSPIDRILLKNCKNKLPYVFKNIKNISWSTFEEIDYQNVIEIIKSFMGNEPLWKIEYYWDGYQ